MKTKGKIVERKTGPRKGQWIVRATITYDDGSTRSKEALVKDKGDHRYIKNAAKEKLDQLIKELENYNQAEVDGRVMTFADLVRTQMRDYAPAIYDSKGQKVEGVRSVRTAKNNIAVLTKYFGRRLIRSIDRGMIRDYKRHRIEEGSRHTGIRKGAPLSIATLNNELGTLRHLLKQAHNAGWITKDPFTNDRGQLIQKSNEDPRSRRITHDEERKLIEACSGKETVTAERFWHGRWQTIEANREWNWPHVRAIIMIAIDAGMRKGEILKLRWCDIDFAAKKITAIAVHTKTQRKRETVLTERVANALRELYETSLRAAKAKGETVEPTSPVFGFSDFKKSWATVKNRAGIKDLHFHDLRTEAISRWVESGLPLEQAGKLAGHTRWDTTFKHYLHLADNTISDLANDLDKKNAGLFKDVPITESGSKMVN